MHFFELGSIYPASYGATAGAGAGVGVGAGAGAGAELMKSAFFRYFSPKTNKIFTFQLKRLFSMGK